MYIYFGQLATVIPWDLLAWNVILMVDSASVNPMLLADAVTNVHLELLASAPRAVNVCIMCSLFAYS